MAYVPVLGDVVEISALGTLAAAGSNGKNVASVYHYRLSVIGTAPLKALLNTSFNNAVGLPFLAAANARYTQTMNNIRYLNDATDLPTSFAVAGVGAIATDGMPTDVSVSMLLRTAKRGREFRGAKRFPAVNEIDTTGDVLTGAGLARWQTLQTGVAATLTDVSGCQWVPCVLSRKLSQLLINPTTVISNDVVQVLLNKNVGTMRRRRVLTVR